MSLIAETCVPPITLELRNVSMAFPGQRALQCVGMKLRRGEIHALVGQNGSGKSTLIKILAGYHTPTPGCEAFLEGEHFALGSAHAAHAAGLRFIHQDLGLVTSLNSVDNLALGRGYQSRWWVSSSRERQRARELLVRYGLRIDVDLPVQELSSAERSMLAIARALSSELHSGAPKVLVLDEPTEALARHEVDGLFAMLRAVAATGTAVLYISHRLDEVLEIADVATVLRDGRVIATTTLASLDRAALVELIVGRRLETMSTPEISSNNREVLRVVRLSGATIDDISFCVRAGEILGIAGLIGSGREELPALLGGAQPWAAGVIEMEDSIVTSLNPQLAKSLRLIFVPSDRGRLGAIPALSARENVTLPMLPTVGPLKWLSRRRERTEVEPWMAAADVLPRDPERKFSTFSGGNQQKLVLARALRLQPRALVIDEPVQGVDVGARVGIFQMLRDEAARGIPIVIASSDADELAKLCSRVLVLGSGRIVAELGGPGVTPDHITDASMLGASAGVLANA